ncbi:hypothetical protein NLG97_g4151 [Lecanicillium saksenae]|uniref:Uncharacterized protein n=1 Tax=Lecanicillium saksenae TaxID=468837 RepID=A0ACC1QW42_9HYPO|nr:hypothetical protein NLG97_g4151 [Lecanicillium saksenae]
MARFGWITGIALSVITKTAQGLASLPRAVEYEESPMNEAPSVLECFQVSNPVLSDMGLVSGDEVIGPPDSYDTTETTVSCQRILMTHSFQNSYGHPYVADYHPPACEFNRVAINLTVQSEGVQYDRLAIMYLGDVEVWRTSTAEPNSHPGVSWTYWKDMTSYLSLWKEDQKLIFDLGNIVNNQYTGAFNVTLTATFFSIRNSDKGNQHEPANWIKPISAKRSSDNKSSAFNYPGDDASVSLKLPQSAMRAVVSISATGQSDEEFWETNVPDSVQSSATGYFAKSAFREARLLIDGQIAGLAWPYPVVFTGGISPPLHRPMVGIQAFDLLENEIDITPWLGILCDGSEHTFTLQIVCEKEQKPNSYWVLTGKVFVWTDDTNNERTTGEAPKVEVSPISLDSSGGGDAGGPIPYQQSISRTIRVSSELKVAGEKSRYTWDQSYSMKNDGNITNAGNDQNVQAMYEGKSTAASASQPYFFIGFKYPFEMNLTTANQDNSFKMSTTLQQGMNLIVTGKTAFSYGVDAFGTRLQSEVSGSVLQTMRNAKATYYQNAAGYKTSGESESHQTYKFGGHELGNATSQHFNPAPLLYSRDVKVIGNKRVLDDVFVYRSDYIAHPERLSLSKFVHGFAPVPNPHLPGMGKFSGKDTPASEGNTTVQWHV